MVVLYSAGIGIGMCFHALAAIFKLLVLHPNKHFTDVEAELVF